VEQLEKLFLNISPAFFVNADPDPSFDDQKLEKMYSGKFIKIFF
jgi:hypothetical protein